MFTHTKPLWIGMLLLLSLLLVSCGPGKPGSQTPKLAPAALWDLHTEAGNKAFMEGRHRNAEQHFLAALEESEQLKIVNPQDHKEVLADDPSVPASLNNLGTLYIAQSRYDDATMILQRALSISETNLGPQHPYLGVTLRNLASLRLAQGQPEEAESLVRRALTIDEGALGSAHPQLGEDFAQLGAIATARGQHRDAEALLKKGLSIRQQSYGPDHPQVALSLLALADGYRDQDQFDRAEPLYERVLEIRKKHFGPNHPRMAESLEHYAILAKKMGRQQEAEEMELEAKRIRATTMTPSISQE